MNAKPERNADLAVFDEFGSFGVSSDLMDISGLQLEIPAGGNIDFACFLDATCPNTICSPGDLTCTGTNVCGTNLGCITNPVC